MKELRIIVLFLALYVMLPMMAHESVDVQIKRQVDRYSDTKDVHRRIRMANDIFAYLLREDYLDSPIVFPEDAHIDSVDVNVYYYIAEWYYGEEQYGRTVDYCSLAAAACSDCVDDNSKADVYSLLGAAYFRLGEFEKAVDALHVCYEIDSKGGDYDQLSSTLNNIASIFVAAGKPEEAEKYILEAIEANSMTHNIVRRSVLFGTASEMYRAMGSSEQSLKYAHMALEIERERGDSAKIGVRLSQVANAELGLSRINEAQRSLEEAMPLLEASGNKHSLGICMNQMGDILASKDQDIEAADYYRQAAELFLLQGDRYNEKHAREGLYKVLKTSAPDEAMQHLERSKQLQDSIYQHETGEALGKYNAIYYNDILQKDKERSGQEKRMVLILSFIAALLVAICVYCIYHRHKRKEVQYQHNISTLQDKYDEANRLYRNLAGSMPLSPDLTEDDRTFLNQLTEVIDSLSEKGITDVSTIATQMHINVVTLRRRLAITISETPQMLILRVRMEKAKYLLLNYRDITISEVSDRCGYSQAANFTRAFLRYYGITPSEAKSKKVAPDVISDKPKNN